MNNSGKIKNRSIFSLFLILLAYSMGLREGEKEESAMFVLRPPVEVVSTLPDKRGISVYEYFFHLLLYHDFFLFTNVNILTFYNEF